MAAGSASEHTESWARRVRSYETPGEYRQLLEELAADPEGGLDVLGRLADHRDPVVRAWAGTAAAAILGSAAIKLLRRLLSDGDADVRDRAREDLITVDPAAEQEMLPSLRRVLHETGDPFGEGRAAMWRLAKLRDDASIELLRSYATRFPPDHHGNRMPLVLAEYIAAPQTIAARIRDHDHDWMFWLIEAASLLPIPGGEAAIGALRDARPDLECLQILDDQPRPGVGGIGDFKQPT